MAFNLKSQAVKDTTRVHITNAVGDKQYDEDGNPCELEIYGKASKQYRQALSDVDRKRVQRKGKEPNFATKVEDNNEMLAAITKAAHNFDLGDGPLASFADFLALYNDPELYFIRDLVSEALEDNGNFIQK